MFPYMQQSNLSQTITTKELPFHPSCLPFYSIVIYCILAITFQSAYQSLPNMNENFTNNLYAYSHLFYREAHKLFLAACFPTSPADPTTTNKPEEKKRHLILLVQASVLLTHFQATAISEEQAFLTIKMGINLVQQGSLTVIDDDVDEKESLFALLKSLDGWYVWLAFYLQKPYSALELDITPIATIKYDVMFERKSKEQRWALSVLDSYTFFLKNLLKKKKSTQHLNINAIKDSLKSLGTPNEEDGFVPNRIIQVYHDILTIQLHSSQLDNNLQSIAEDTLDTNDYTTLDTLNICISSSQNILKNINKVIFADNATAPLKYIPLSIIYSTCLVSQINLHFLKNKKSASTLFKPSITMRKEIDTLQSNLIKVLKTASPYFEAFQILHNKFNPTTPKRVDTTSVNKTSTISPSPTSLSTSSSTTTHTTNPLQVSSSSAAVVMNPTLASETNHFLSSFHTNNHSDLLIANDSQHMTMNLPMAGGISSRADIDREQLEKLSHTKSHHNHHHQNYHQQQQQNIHQQNMQQQQQLQLQHQQMLLQKQQLNQFQLQQQQQQQQQQQPNSYYLPKYTKRTENGFNAQQQPLNDPCYYYKNNQGQKRSYQPQQQLYNQFDYSITQPALKRQRSNTAISYDMYPTKPNNQGVVMEGSQHERSKSVATTEFIELEPTSDEFMYNMWMLEGATPTPTEEIYDNRQQLKAHHSYNNNMSFLSPQPPQPPLPPPPQQEINNNSLTKLPLPQPSKQTSMLSKRWLTSAQAQKNNNIFFHSEVQTLHYQTPPLVNFDTNTSFPMVGLNVIQEVDQETNTNSNLMYPSHRASIVSDHSGSSGSHHQLLNNVVNSSSASTEETTDAAAAAAVAVWASTAVSFPKMNSRQYNDSTTASISSLEENNDRVPPPVYQQQQGTSNNSGTVHWINSEKVGDEEYWV
ncbi:hypothetical protein BDF21DRAFT_407548, partial [Thamnidium elegans]